VAKRLSEQEILRLARLGALARLRELEEEAKAIRRMFPGLKFPGFKAVPEGAAPAPKPERKARGRKGGGGHMSPEARKAAAERMKAYWARKKGLVASPAETASGAAETAADTPRKSRGRKAARGRKRR